jgi:hypothetical protein
MLSALGRARKSAGGEGRRHGERERENGSPSRPGAEPEPARPTEGRGIPRIRKTRRRAFTKDGRAVGAALNPDADPLKAGSLAVKLIETADPPNQAVLELSAELTPEGVENLSYSDLIRLADSLGLTPPEPSELPAPS